MKLNVFQDSRQITRAIWVVFALIIIVLIVFAGYYYWDRYVYLDDQTPLEMGILNLEEQVRAEPDSIDTRLALAEGYFREQQYPQAIDQAQQVVDAYPDNERAQFILGMAYIFSGDASSGVLTLEEFVDKRRNSNLVKSDMTLQASLYYLGEGYLALGRSDDAIDALTEAVQISPTDADALFQLGNAYLDTDDCERAVEHYSRAVSFVPDFAEAYQGLASCYKKMEMVGHEHYAGGMVAYSLQEYKQALIDLEQATQILPDFGPAYVGLGLVLEELGELDAAKAALEHALILEPESFLAVNSLQRIQLLLGSQ
jgi:tetratricopeptide (TPR) repeat protein